MTRKQLVVAFSLMALVLAGLLYINRQRLIAPLFGPTDSTIASGDIDQAEVRTQATDLVTPWSISFLPGGDMLVSERGGQLKRLGEAGTVFPIADVKQTSEGGLLGIALHPEFERNDQLYLYYTTEREGTLSNQIDRAELRGDTLSGQKTILSSIPAASNHNGGEIKFGPDGKLYVTTGDAAIETLAQDTNSLAGKILRLNPDGTVPSDNPFGNLIWSYGHRNPQGIAWDDKGRLWSVEHGPSGSETGHDELNLVEKGGNYGWPKIRGDETGVGMKTPVLNSGTKETWAPAGMVYAGGELYFTGLRGQSLYKVDIAHEQPAMTRYFTGEYGRLRAIASRTDLLYIGTSNRDGRGSPKDGDDKILSAPIVLFNE